MRRAFSVPLASALLVAGVADAQIAPGIRAPADVAGAVRNSLQLGCLLAVYGRPFPGLNSDFSLAGKGLHAPTGPIPAVIAGVMNRKTRMAVLDAPGGAAWIVFDPDRRRCSVVPFPTDMAGMDLVAAEVFVARDDWKPSDDGTGKFSLELSGAPAVRGWYRPATGTAPQMIIMEPVQ